MDKMKQMYKELDDKELEMLIGLIQVRYELLVTEFVMTDPEIKELLQKLVNLKQRHPSGSWFSNWFREFTSKPITVTFANRTIVLN